jgi:hypothetical protein
MASNSSLAILSLSGATDPGFEPQSRGQMSYCRVPWSSSILRGNFSKTPYFMLRALPSDQSSILHSLNFVSFIATLTHLLTPFVRKMWNRFCSAGIVAGYRMHDWGIPAGSRRSAESYWERPASYPMYTAVIYMQVKRLGNVANHLPRTSAQVKNIWIYISIFPNLALNLLNTWTILPCLN